MDFHVRIASHGYHRTAGGMRYELKYEYAGDKDIFTHGDQAENMHLYVMREDEVLEEADIGTALSQHDAKSGNIKISGENVSVGDRLHIVLKQGEREAISNDIKVTEKMIPPAGRIR